MGRMDGKVALITGGAEGIGAAIGRLIVADGGSVMLADIRGRWRGRNQGLSR